MNRIWISNGLELLSWFETDVLGFETKIYQWSRFGKFQYRWSKKGAQKEVTADEETEEEQEALVHLGTHVNNFFIQVLPMLKCTSTINIFTIQKFSKCKSLTFPTISRWPSLNTKEFCTARGETVRTFRMKLWKRFCINLFLQEV